MVAATAACERAVDTASRLSASTKAELRFVCRDDVEGVIKDDHRTDRTVCREVTNATPSREESVKRRSYSTCYATATGVLSH